jgi:hypothetical protein
MVPQKPKKTLKTPLEAGQKQVEPGPTPLEPKWGVQGLCVGHLRPAQQRVYALQRTLIAIRRSGGHGNDM